MTMKKINILVNDLNKLDNTMAVSIVTGSRLFSANQKGRVKW